LAPRHPFNFAYVRSKAHQCLHPLLRPRTPHQMRRLITCCTCLTEHMHLLTKFFPEQMAGFVPKITRQKIGLLAYLGGNCGVDYHSCELFLLIPGKQQVKVMAFIAFYMTESVCVGASIH